MEEESLTARPYFVTLWIYSTQMMGIRKESYQVINLLFCRKNVFLRKRKRRRNERAIEFNDILSCRCLYDCTCRLDVWESHKKESVSSNRVRGAIALHWFMIGNNHNSWLSSSNLWVEPLPFESPIYGRHRWTHRPTAAVNVVNELDHRTVTTTKE